MRKDARTQANVVLNQVHGYHEGHYNGNYAFQGFGENRYYTSDRFIRLDESFRRPDGKPLMGYGLEIETECRGITNATVYAETLQKIILSQFPEYLFKLQRDGSLGGDVSAECITQVMTREFIRNNYKAFKAMYDVYFPAFGISCASSGNCGMHVNISCACFGKTKESQALAIRKLLYFVNHHFNFCCTLFNRNMNRTCYCSRMSGYDFKDACKTVSLANFYSDHGVCFNLGHYEEGRIELRLVGGQSTFGCFRNTMESLFWLVGQMKRLSWDDLDDLGKVFDGCNQYVCDRLNTLCRRAGTISEHDLAKITVEREELL